MDKHNTGGAKYTELLIDYLEDNELPTVFDEIDGLKNQFIAYYCNYEIGFETEALFKIKLCAKAELIVPIYKEMIENSKKAIADVLKPFKRTDSKVNTGERKGSTTDLPIDSDVAEPNQETHQNASEDKTEIVETDLSLTQALERVKYLEDHNKNIIEALLREFRDLFMVIY